MKSKLILAGLVVILALSMLACSSTPQRLVVIASVDSPVSEEVEIAVGGSLVVHLESNPTTGFKWELSEITDQMVLKQDGEPEFVPPDEAIPGAGGREIWTFKALSKGTSTISMEYSRPWEGGEKAEWTYILTVIVK